MSQDSELENEVSSLTHEGSFHWEPFGASEFSFTHGPLRVPLSCFQPKTKGKSGPFPPLSPIPLPAQNPIIQPAFLEEAGRCVCVCVEGFSKTICILYESI